MKFIALTAVTAFALAGVAVFTTTSSATNDKAPVVRSPQVVKNKDKTTKVSAKEQKQLKSTRKLIAGVQKDVWACQDALGEKRYKSQYDIWSYPKSVKFRVWVVNQWLPRLQNCTDRKAAKMIPETTDWVTAVNIVQRMYPGTKDWLLYISHREGGYGGFVMNHQGSGAGGWMQFMSGTYYGYSPAAFADAKRRGFIVQDSWNQWTHPLGQAITAGYMKYYGREGCHWCL
jgi:Skp family chaperone for outer membrane proteins